MAELTLHEAHARLKAVFTTVNGEEAVEHYGDFLAEHAALCREVAVLDLGFRGRLCLTGADRQRMLNGQVTNNVKDLAPGQGCHAALVNHKARIEADLHIHVLEGELLLDFEPGLTDRVTARLEKFIIADVVQVVPVAPHYGLLSVQGPRAAAVLQNSAAGLPVPGQPYQSARHAHPALGEMYVINLPRLGTTGYDVFAPVAALPALWDELFATARRFGGGPCGWRALEVARIEAGIPRFGVDMDETNLAPEALDERSISYTKGCYTGQEVIARIRTYGQVAKSLHRLRLADNLPALPQKGDKLFSQGREAGYLTSAAHSPALPSNIGLGYVRKEFHQPGTELRLRGGGQESPVVVR